MNAGVFTYLQWHYLAFDLTLPNNQESCTFPLFWGRVVKYLCSQAVGQPYVDNILRSPQCTSIARHFTNFCGRGKVFQRVTQGFSNVKVSLE